MLSLVSQLQVNLSSNCLCGVWEAYDGEGHRVQMGSYTSNGVTALAEALKVTGSLTKIS